MQIAQIQQHTGTQRPRADAQDTDKLAAHMNGLTVRELVEHEVRLDQVASRRGRELDALQLQRAAWL
jgi:hypothetical protein